MYRERERDREKERERDRESERERKRGTERHREGVNCQLWGLSTLGRVVVRLEAEEKREDSDAPPPVLLRKPETGNPKPETRNPKSENQNPKPEIRSPKLEI